MPTTIEEGAKTVSTPNTRPVPFTHQRRSQRILLTVPLRVSGKHAAGKAFAEFTNTLIVNAHGALINLRERVREGQSLRVRNVSTGEEVECRVMDVNPGPNGVPEIGLEFMEPNPRFWRVSFPPADWTPRSPEAKRFATGPNQGPPPIEVAASKPVPKK